MAGPVASVLLPTKLTEARKTLLRSDIARIATDVRGDDFWVDGRPFILGVGPESVEQLTEIAESGIAGVLGWLPRDVVSFSAMSKSDQDHRILAELCIGLAEREAGVIDFGGWLAIGPTLDESVQSKPLRVENPAGMSGVLFAASYQTVSGAFATTHYGDATFVRSWLQHPDFYMVK